eukprot:sb/3475204/
MLGNMCRDIWKSQDSRRGMKRSPCIGIEQVDFEFPMEESSVFLIFIGTFHLNPINVQIVLLVSFLGRDSATFSLGVKGWEVGRLDRVNEIRRTKLTTLLSLNNNILSNTYRFVLVPSQSVSIQYKPVLP